MKHNLPFLLLWLAGFFANTATAQTTSPYPEIRQAGLGKVMTDIRYAQDIFLDKLAIFPDGGCLLFASGRNDASNTAMTQFFLLKYLPDGNLDTRFGSQGMVRVLHPAFAQTWAYPAALLLRPDGSFLAVAWIDTRPDRILLFAFQANGKLDGRFGSGGTLDFSLSDFGVPNRSDYDFVSTSFSDAALQKDGSLLVSGFCNPANEEDERDAFLLRFLPNGKPDPAFGKNGLLLFGNDNGLWEFGYTVRIQQDGNILWEVGQEKALGEGSQRWLFRYLSDGTPDPSFGTKGAVLTGNDSATNHDHSLTLQADGRIVSLTSKYIEADGGKGKRLRLHKYGLQRFSSSGILDTVHWSGKGWLETGLTTDFASKICLQAPHENLLVSGGIDGKSFFRRFLPDGKVDTTFGSGGTAQIDQSQLPKGLRDWATLPDGKILIVGSEFQDGGISMLRLLPNGRWDTSFGNQVLLTNIPPSPSSEPKQQVSGAFGKPSRGGKGKGTAPITGKPPTKASDFDYAFPTDHGMFKVQFEGRQTFTDSNWQVQAPWRWYDHIGHFWQGVAPVMLDGKWGLVRPDGQLILPIEQDTLHNTTRAVYWFQKNGLWGMVSSRTGEVLHPPVLDEYYYASPFNGFAASLDGKYGLLDSTGQWALAPRFDWIFPDYSFYDFNSPFIVCLSEGEVTFLKKDLRTFLPLKLEYHREDFSLEFRKGKLWARQRGLWGLTDTLGNWLIPPRFERIKSSPDWKGHWVQEGGRGLWGYIDSSGKYLVRPMPLQEPYGNFVEGHIWVHEKPRFGERAKYGLLAKNGQWKILPTASIYMDNESENLKVTWIITKEGHSVVCDKRGNILVPVCEVEAMGEGNLKIKQPGRKHISFFNPKGVWIKEPGLEQLGTFESGFAYAQKNGLWGLISQNGHWVVPPKYAASGFVNPVPMYRTANISFTDEEGNQVPNIPHNLLFWFQEQRAGWRLADTSGVFVPGFSQDSAYAVRLLGSRMFALGNRSKETDCTRWTLHGMDGKPLPGQEYEDLVLYQNHGYEDDDSILAKKGGRWGRIDMQGQIVVPFISDEDWIGVLSDGCFVITLWGEEFWVNSKGLLSMGKAGEKDR